MRDKEKGVQKFSGYRMAAVAGAILFMNQGALGTFSLFIRPIAEGNGFDLGSVMICVSFSTVGGILLGFIAQPFVEKLKPKGCLTVATVTCGIHYWGFAFSHTLWAHWLWASITACTVVFGSAAVIGSIIGKWFIEKRAAVLGFVFGASALGTAAWQLISGYLITLYGYRVAYMVMGAALIAIGLTANLGFLRMPEQLGQKPLGWEAAGQQGAAGQAAEAPSGAKQQQVAMPTQSAGADAAGGLTVSEARKTLAYWLIFGGLILSPMSVGGSKSNVATFLTGEGMSVLTASRYTSLMMFIGAAATIMSGFISQKMGNRIYMYYMHIAFILGTAVLLLNASLSPALMFVSIFLYALAAPVNSAMGPTVNSQAFGNRDYTGILVSMTPAGLIGGSVQPILTAFVLQSGGSLKYVYIVFACLNLGGLILLTSGLAASKRLRDNTIK